jgi:glycerate dehydrogenase
MNGVFLDSASLGNDVNLDAFDNLPINWFKYPQTSPEQTLERLKDAEIALTNKVVINDEHFKACPNLRYIGILATGTNNVDLNAAKQYNVAVTNVIKYGTPSVVQHTFALILNLSIHLQNYLSAVKNGEWQNSPLFWMHVAPIRELKDLTLGIVGYGELGRGVAKLAQAFEMKVLIAQRAGKNPPVDHLPRLPLSELLPQVDVLSLHCPLTPDTHHLIDKQALSLMKPDAILINTARGGLVDEAALAEALRAGKLGGAGFDVLTVEPPKNGNPLLNNDIQNLLITPHIAWAARESRQRSINQAAENLAIFLNGGSQNRVA